LKSEAHWTPALLVECTQFVAQVASGARAVDTGSVTPPAGPVSAPEDGDEPDDVEAFLALDIDEQIRRADRGHLPEGLRATGEQLDMLRTNVEALDAPRRAWVETQAQIAGLPNLGHPDRWSIDRARTLAGLLDTAEQLTDEQLAPPDWATLCKAAGITKAAAGREAKRLATELGIRVPAKVDDLPTDGVFAVRFAEWIEAMVATSAKAGAAA
jgi:hypothetical protein